MTAASYQLDGKRVLITGASRGLGEVCAKTLAEAGASVLLSGRDRERLERLRHGLHNSDLHRAFVGDLTSLPVIEKLVAVIEAFGPLDVVLHCMGGGLGMREPLLHWEQFETLFRTNLGSQAELNRRLIPGMIERKTGNIVMVGSLASSEAVGSVGYNTVKAALAGYTRSLGRSLAETSVIVTGILPGAFVAPENAWVRLQARDPEVVARVISERQPRKRLGDVSELMPMILLLCSRKASMMSGCMVPIDGAEGLGYTG